MLNVETRGSQSLLNIAAFTDPTAYKLKVKRPGSDESREVNVDLLETFNWLIGLTVRHIAAPQMFSAAFERDSEKRLHMKGRLKQNADGRYWFRTVIGTTPPNFSISILAIPIKCFVLLLGYEMLFIIGNNSSNSALLILSASGNFAKIAGVVRFTRLSVHWAESITATSN